MASVRVICAIILYQSWRTLVIHMSLQTNDKVAFEEIPVTYSAHPYIFVLVLFLDAVVLLHVYVAFNIFYQHIVHIDCTGVARIFVWGGGHPADATQSYISRAHV